MLANETCERYYRSKFTFCFNTNSLLLNLLFFCIPGKTRILFSMIKSYKHSKSVRCSIGCFLLHPVAIKFWLKLYRVRIFSRVSWQKFDTLWRLDRGSWINSVFIWRPLNWLSLPYWQNKTVIEFSSKSLSTDWWIPWESRIYTCEIK